MAPLFFRGEIEFGVINQSSSAFNHILTDVSLVVYQARSCRARSPPLCTLVLAAMPVCVPRSVGLL